MKGIIYIMTTAVSGVIKIGKTGAKQYQERMRHLEHNGYYNVVGLRKYFAIEVSDYDDKEKLIQEIFSNHKIADSELFALDYELVKQLLLSFDGKIIYPTNVNKEKEFDLVTKTRKQGELFSFYKKGLKKGDKIVFKDDSKVIAEICGEREVKYEGEVYKLSPLVYKLYERMGRLNKSGAYQGAAYFEYNGKRLLDLKDK